MSAKLANNVLFLAILPKINYTGMIRVGVSE
jgi:hypothetical protein